MDRAKKAWINLILLGLTLGVNSLGAFGLFNGLSQKDISDRYLTLITPSSSTFGIWGLIYGLLILAVIVTILRQDDPYYGRAIDELSGLFWLSCLMNIGWIVAFSFVLLELSVGFIFAFVITLAWINRKLGKFHEAKRWLLPLTFGLYGGWLFIASVVNTAAMLVKRGWNGFGVSASLWAVVILVVAIILVGLVLLRLRNAAFPLPIAWAFFGIYQQQRIDMSGDVTVLMVVSLLGMVVLIGLAAIQLYRNQYEVLPIPHSSGL